MRKRKQTYPPARTATSQRAANRDIPIQRPTVVSIDLTARTGGGTFGIGDRVRILPNHACSTAAQHRSYRVVSGASDRVEAEWPRFGGW